MDNYSTSFEAGRYLDTVGFVSFPTKQNATMDANSTNLFRHEFLDANVATLRLKLGVSTLKTESGAALSEFIESTRESMGLMQVVGCAPKTFHLDRALGEGDSLWGLYTRVVLPNQFSRGNSSIIVLQSKYSSLRYDLFAGHITVDDVHSVSPFNDTLYRIAADIPGSTILTLNETLNQGQDEFTYLPSLPKFVFSGSVSSKDKYDLFAVEFEVETISSALADIYDGKLLSEKSDSATTSLWFSFIEESWSCSSKKHPWHGSTSGNSEVVQIGLCIFFILLAVDTTVVAVLMGVFAFRKFYIKPMPVFRENGHRQYDTWESGTFA